MMKAACFGHNKTKLELVYPQDRREIIVASCEMHPETITAQNFGSQRAALADIDVIFSTWGMPALAESQIARM